jgi:5-methyltetrahydrofolate--homocysteine methyltransferase
MSEGLIAAITSMSKDDALRITHELLESNVDPEEILNDGRIALETIGERFESGEFFLPELIVSGDIMGAIAEVVKPHLQADVTRENIGKVVIGTVEGDIHDIGKDIVVFMLDINGFEVIDLGVDVPVNKFVEATREHQPDIVGLSGFLALAVPPMKETVSALREAGMVEFKIMIGGGPINDQVREHTGADGWGKDAMEGVSLAKHWLGVAQDD